MFAIAFFGVSVSTFVGFGGAVLVGDGEVFVGEAANQFRPGTVRLPARRERLAGGGHADRANRRGRRSVRHVTGPRWQPALRRERRDRGAPVHETGFRMDSLGVGRGRRGARPGRPVRPWSLGERRLAVHRARNDRWRTWTRCGWWWRRRRRPRGRPAGGSALRRGVCLQARCRGAIRAPLDAGFREAMSAGDNFGVSLNCRRSSSDWRERTGEPRGRRP